MLQMLEWHINSQRIIRNSKYSKNPDIEQDMFNYSMQENSFKITTGYTKLLPCNTLHDYRLILVAQEQACLIVDMEVPEMLK